MPSFPVTLVTATGINKDINEVSCQAKITSLNSIQPKGAVLKYTLRPSLDQSGQVSVDVNYDTWFPLAIGTLISDWRDSKVVENSAVVSDAEEPETGASKQSYGHDLDFDEGFEDYPAEIFAKPTSPLRLSKGQKTYITRFKEAYKQPVNFGGSLVILQFGCGTGCTFAFALDNPAVWFSTFQWEVKIINISR